MSLSFDTSVNGLLSQSYAIANTSNNMANASTTAYKAETTSFEELVSECATADSSGTDGASAQTTYQNTAQGIIQSTSTATNLAINGSGYFAVQDASGTGVYYTRAGDFTLNADGDLENSEGYLLLGESPTAPGTYTAINIPSTLTSAAVPTTTLDYAANLDASAAAGTSSSASNVTVYNSSDTSGTLSYTWTKDDSNAWTLSVSAPDGASSGGTTANYTASINVGFNQTGGIETIGTGTNYTVSGNTVTFTLDYPGAAAQTISCDLSNVTQYASTSSTPITADVSTFTQNGAPAGAYSGISIDDSGNVSVNYDNGLSTVLYEIPVATFVNPDGLQALAGNAYTATISSGAATYNAVGSNGAGTLKTEALESSNVDIANEFTDMIRAQQVYSANAKAVSTINSMMQTLIQLQSV